MCVVAPHDDDHGTVENGIAQFESQQSTASECRRLALGFVIVICIALSWVGAVQLTKISYSEAFSAPLFLVWLGTSWMMTLFPVASAIYFLTAPHRFRNPEAALTYWRHCTHVFSPSGITFRSLLTSMVLFTSLWVGTNYSYSRALMYASATDVATLTSSSSAFIVLLSICILKEPILILKILAVLLSCGGIALFSYAEGFQPVQVVGVCLSLVSTIGIAMYKVLLKWRVGDASVYQMALFLSVIGAFNTVTLFPVVLLLHFTGVEILYHIPWNYVIWSSILGVIFNFLINFGIAYTYPLFISLGTLLGIPINATIDALVHNIDLVNWKIPGAILIMSGFLMLLAPPSDSLTIHKFILRLIRWQRTT
eukprot:Em0017g580a